MKLTVKLQGGELLVNVADLLGSFTGEERDQLIEQLACEDAIIERVAEQLVTGWTEAGNHGYKSGGHTPSTPLDKAIRRVAEAAGEVAVKEISRLASVAKNAEESRAQAWRESMEWRDKYYDLKAGRVPA